MWALTPPGYYQDWHVGIRNSKTNALMAFITGVPATIKVRSSDVKCAEINFLCAHKKLRAKRLAPVLIKEGMHMYACATRSSQIPF
jgi:glycylpeptide N-tetradecanoyltransferase